MSLYPSFLLVSSRRYRQEQPVIQPPARYRVVWDDENIDFGYKCRTQTAGFIGPDNPPAVMRFYPEPIDKMGDFRVNLSTPYDWKPTIIAINGGVYGDWEYLVDPKRATYNTTGWPMQAYLTMSGNELDVLEITAGWVKFRTLRQADAEAAKSMTLGKHVHKFTCVTWKDGKTVHIESTGTPRGEVLFPLVSKEGYGYIPLRHVVKI